MIAQVTFGAPVVLWGALAAAGPILIHLILRTRAQLTPLPTVRFVIQTQQQTKTRQRLRHLLLLLLRILALLLLVGALARPRLATRAFSAPTRAPTEAIFCLDDSASMRYRSQEQTCFDRARTFATTLLEDRRRFPTGSRAGLMTSSGITSARLSLDVDGLRRQADALRAGYHGRGVGRMLTRAAALLDSGVLDAKEIYLLTDRTRNAFQDLRNDFLRDQKDVMVYCLDVGVEQDINFALVLSEVPDRAVPVGTNVQIGFRVRPGGVPGRRSVEILIDGRPRWRSGPMQLEARRPRSLSASLANLLPGVHQGEIRLEPADPIDVDNVRYFTVEVGARPKALLIGPAGSQVADLVAAMVAPQAVPEEARRVDLTRIDSPDPPSPPELEAYEAVVLADVAQLSPEAGERLRKFVTRGGCLVFVPGPRLDVEAPGELASLLPAPPRAVVTPDEALHITSPEADHPFLAPFGDASGLSLSEPAVRRYVRFGSPAEGSRILARLSDGSPAILTRRWGQGRTVALAFAPIRTWGEFAFDAGPMLVLLHTILGRTVAESTPPRHLTVGALAHARFASPRDPSDARPIATSISIDGLTERRRWQRPIEPDTGRVPLVTESPGHYVVGRDNEGGTPPIRYSVNVPDDESDLRRVTESDLLRRFPQGRFEIVREPEDLRPVSQRGAATHELTGWLALALLGVLIAESMLSNRFYRRPEGEDPLAAAEPRLPKDLD